MAMKTPARTTITKIMFLILQVQRYEGASTIYGPHTLTIYLSQYRKLASALVKASNMSQIIVIIINIFIIIYSYSNSDCPFHLTSHVADTFYNSLHINRAALFTPWAFTFCSVTALSKRFSVASVPLICSLLTSNIRMPYKASECSPLPSTTTHKAVGIPRRTEAEEQTGLWETNSQTGKLVLKIAIIKSHSQL